MITVLEADRTDITDNITSIELVSGNDDFLRFFVSSPSEHISIRMQGLIKTDRVATFTVDAQANVTSDDRSDTFQTN